MIRDSRLPPLFRLDARAEGADIAHSARRAAASGADPGTVVCADGAVMLDAAVVLNPETAMAEAALVIYVATLGLGDAIGAVVPAGIDVTYRWPNRIEANTGAVAEIFVDAPDGAGPDDVPDWLVVHVVAAVGPLADGWREGGFPETSLRDEGCDEVTTSDLLESFARHFLTWLNRWKDDGFGPVRAMWLRHAPTHQTEATHEIAGERIDGLFRGIDDDGAMIIERAGATRRIALDQAMRRAPKDGP